MPLTTSGAIYGGSGLGITFYGIKVSSAGKYRVSGSVYLEAPAAVYSYGVYLKKSANGSVYASSTELGGTLTPKPTTQAFTGAVQFAPRLFSLAANDVVFLAARARGANGTVYVSNNMTYLLVEKVG